MTIKKRKFDFPAMIIQSCDIAVSVFFCGNQHHYFTIPATKLTPGIRSLYWLGLNNWDTQEIELLKCVFHII